MNLKDYKAIDISRRDRVLVLVLVLVLSLNRPEALNAVNGIVRGKRLELPVSVS